MTKKMRNITKNEIEQYNFIHSQNASCKFCKYSSQFVNPENNKMQFYCDNEYSDYFDMTVTYNSLCNLYEVK